MCFVIGVDIGGSHITSAIIDIESRSVLKETLVRSSINSGASATEIINDWSKSIILTLESYPNPINRIGFAMPGPFDYENGVSKMKDNGKYESLYNLSVKELITESLGIKELEILMLNDAAAFLQGEKFSGVAKEFYKPFAITLGTGLGSAIYTNEISNNLELWSMPFLNGIAEDFLSTRWFVKKYFELTGKYVIGVKEMIETSSSDMVVQNIFEEFSENLTNFILLVSQNHEFDSVVIGGNIVFSKLFFLNKLLKKCKGKNITSPIVPAILGESAAMLGAASLFK
jgi:glucokinase